MEKTVSGLKIEGDWEEVVESSEEVSETLKESISEEKFEDWEYWRPKDNEEIDEEIKDKTIEIACVDESPVEDKDKSLISEFKDAFSEIKKSVTNRNRGRKRFRKGLFKLINSIEAVSRKVFRSFEKVIYKYIISKTNPQYFDGEKVSASLDQKNELFNEKEKYVMEININDEELCKEVQEDI